jgi:carnosine synthase
VLDGPGHWTQSAPELFEQFIEVDLADHETLPARALQAIRASGLQFDAVATFWELAGTLTAQIAEALGVVGHPLSAIATARHKARSREVCRDAGIPTPRFASIFSSENVGPAASEVGFPAVLKPISGVSSTSVYLVQCLSELQARYAQVMDEARPGADTSMLHSDNLAAFIWGGGTEMLLEEYLDGEEFDADCLLYAGDLVYARLVRDLPQPHMVESGQQMPPNHPEERQSALITLAHQALAAMGFANGAFHVEVKDTSHGPRLIEVNARIGGGSVWIFHQRVWDVDLVEQYLMIQLGLPINPQPAPAPQTSLITADLPAPYTGTVTHIRFLDHLAGHPNVLAAYAKVHQGQRVVGPDTGVPEWMGEIMVEGESITHAEQIMAELLTTLQLPIMPE